MSKINNNVDNAVLLENFVKLSIMVYCLADEVVKLKAFWDDSKSIDIINNFIMEFRETPIYKKYILKED